jgi:hypothetical protein
MKKIGRLINLGIANEATRGTAVAPTNWLPKSNITFEDKVQKAPSQVGYGNIGEGNQDLVALKWSEGDVEFDLMSESFGVILKSVFGTVSSASYATSAYEHTFSVQNDNQHDSMTLWVEDSAESIDKFFEMVMVNNLSLSLVPEEVIKCTVGFIGRSSEDTSGLAHSYVAESKFVGRHASIKIADAVGDLDAASKLNIKELTLDINKNANRDHSLGTVQAVDITNQKFEITGKITLDLEDETYKALMNDGTYQALRIMIENTDETIGSAGNPSFLLELSKCAFDGWEANRPNDEIVSQVINFKALFSITNDNVVNDCHLRNTTASY